VTSATSEVLASIDGALAAYGTVDYGDTGDQMRWRPETPGLVICDDGQPLPLARWSPPAVRTDVTEAGIGRPDVLLRFAAGWEAFSVEVVNATRAIHDLYAVWRSPQHKRRCRECNPRGNPPPLKVDGREYRRRIRNRRKRGR
jgi:hypothetical protein